MKMTEEEIKDIKKALTNLVKKSKGNNCLSNLYKNILFLFEYPECFDTYRFDTDILKKEFDDMSDERKEAYRDAFGIDIDTIKHIVDMFHENNIEIIYH